jgi:hypothetical protein
MRDAAQKVSSATLPRCVPSPCHLSSSILVVDLTRLAPHIRLNGRALIKREGDVYWTRSRTESET